MKQSNIWRNLRVLLGVLVIVAAPEFSSGGEEGAVGRADRAEGLYTQAMNILRESIDEKGLTEAVGLLEQAAELDPAKEDIWIQISWRYWMLGDDLPKKRRRDRKRRLELFKKGMSAGQRAMEINPKSVGGIYWYTVNMAATGEMKGIISCLWMAGTLFGNMGRVDRRDPYYLHGATRRFGSEVFVRVPRWLIERFGFKIEYIEEDLLDSIQRWPHCFDNYTYLARVYWWNGDKDKALEQLEYVLTHSPDSLPEERAENIKQQKTARKMWKKYTGKEFPER